tara:strand:+ start:3486 stop:4433 length:948 start_codon:yes stop_codon:yes gene_type:complete
MVRWLYMSQKPISHHDMPRHDAATSRHAPAQRGNIAAYQDTNATNRDSDLNTRSKSGTNTESNKLYTLSIPEVRKMLVEAGHVVSERTLLRWCAKELLDAALRPEENGQYEKYYVNHESVTKKISQLDRVRPSTPHQDRSQDTTATSQDNGSARRNQLENSEENNASDSVDLKNQIQDLKDEILIKNVDIQIKDKLLIREKEATRDAWNKISDVGEQVGEWKTKYEQLKLAAPAQSNPEKETPRYREVEFKAPNNPTQTKIDNSTKNNFDSTTIEETPAKTGDRKHKSQRIGKFGRFLGYAIIAALSALTTLLFL